MQTEVYNLVSRFSRSNCAVLLQGERGLGKAQIAKLIHERSPRATNSFVGFSLLDLTETFIDTELFGVSDAMQQGFARPAKGMLRDVEGGTIFLQEIGEFPLGIQRKLLKLIRNRQIEPFGGGSQNTCDVRVVAGSSDDLAQLVEQGRFNTELYEELSTYAIRIPPLRERKSDILHLSDAFLAKHSAANGRRILRISSAAMSLVLAYPWPGNLAELEQAIARAVLLCTGDCIEPHHLPDTLRDRQDEQMDHADTLQSTLHNLERALIIDALRATRGNCAKAAVMLGITERLMGLRVKKYGIDPRLYRGSDL